MSQTGRTKVLTTTRWNFEFENQLRPFNLILPFRKISRCASFCSNEPGGYQRHLNTTNGTTSLFFVCKTKTIRHLS